ncbi:MAG: response regulator [Desulfomonilaceae bacterium]
MVDDDDRIREIGRQSIEMGGYHIITARSGEDALSIYTSHKKQISLIILDLIMPGMGGKRCLEELTRIDPDVRVLISSGYSEDGLTAGENYSGARGFMSKPYDAKEILIAIRKVLDTGYL